MNIKETLSAYRPDSTDPDPLIDQALEAAENDPEVLQWFTEQIEMDNAIRQSLKAQQPPEDLLDKVLEYQDAVKSENKIIRPLFRNALIWRAAAACLIFTALFTLKDTIINNQIFGYHAQLASIEKHDDFRIAMSEFVDTTIISLDYLAEEHSDIRSWLNDNNQLSFASLPRGLETLDTLGCKSFKWKNQTVSLVCFHSVEGHIVHLFIKEVHQSEDTEILAGRYASMQTIYGRQTKGWVTDNKHYMMVGSDPEVDLSGIMI